MHASWYDYHGLPEIDHEPISEPPGTIVYTRDPDEELAKDANELAEIRARRKARIQAASKIYLAGGQLSLISTALKGPFNNGWVNPWSARGTKRKHGQAVEQPENAVEVARKLLRTNELKRLPTTPPPPSIPAISDPFLSARTQPQNQPTPEEKVNSWLRRYNEVKEQPAAEATSSSNPRRKVGSEQRPVPTLARTPSRQFIAVSSQDVHAPGPVVDSRFGASQGTVVPAGIQSSQPVNTHSALQHALQTYFVEDEGIGLEVDDIPDPTHHRETSTRAEDAIMMLRQHSLTTPRRRMTSSSREPPSSHRTSTPSHGPLANSRRHSAVMSFDQPQLPPNSAASEAVSTGHRADDREAAAIDSAPVGGTEPMISKDMPPSAQPRTQLATSISNVSSLPLLSTLAGPAARDPVDILQVSTSLDRATSNEEQVRRTVSFRNTDDLLFQHDEQGDSRPETKSSNSGKLQGTILPKGTGPPKKKTASFAVQDAESFTPGIKNTMRVQKASSSSPRRSPRKKGILRSKNMASVSETTKTTTSKQSSSTSRKRLDAFSQLLDGQNGAVQDKDGQLEEVLDNMSSFLSTYDVDVQAKSIQF